ncbi:Protein of unknown function DUF247, plant [Dillenia turbinata]|uniref:Uncharacterized protein n=1 Tax=Dillenia turbinata TaxID=194707 RepID=A0AAN8VC93_9MAGN
MEIETEPYSLDRGRPLFHVDEGVADAEIELNQLRIGRRSNGTVRTCDGNSVEDLERAWLISMGDGIKQIPKLLKTSAGKITCSIFRVPPNLFENFENSYRPKIVSIGPYHHGKDNFEMIEEHKWRFLGSFLARWQRNGVGLNKYFHAMASIEETIYDLSKGFQNSSSLLELALRFFKGAVHSPIERLEEAKHLLDLFRLIFSPLSIASINGELNSNQMVQLIPSARKLNLAGIKLKAISESDSSLDIKYNFGILEIPTITTDDFSCCVLLNCVAFEQCYSHCPKHFTAYAALMGCLIKTADDAELLSTCKILENYFMSAEEAAKTFSNLGRCLALDLQGCYLSQVFVGVNEFRERKSLSKGGQRINGPHLGMGGPKFFK